MDVSFENTGPSSSFDSHSLLKKGDNTYLWTRP